MTWRLADEVTIDYSGVCVCPWHGPQAGAEYADSRAPCGCQWVMNRNGRALRARRGVTFASEVAITQLTRSGQSCGSANVIAALPLPIGAQLAETPLTVADNSHNRAISAIPQRVTP